MATSILAPDVEQTLQDASAPRTIKVAVDGDIREITSPFPSPTDWRDHWIYFLLVDRFNNPDAPPRHAPFDGQHGVFQGGTLEGVREQLGYLQQLGVGAIWLSPVLKNCQYSPFSYHGYGIQDFLQVDPRFASDPEMARDHPALVERELRALVDEAHARGLYVILDIVLNHTGDVFAYELENGQRVSEAPWRPTPYEIEWRREDGAPVDDVDWRERRPSPDAVVWPAELQHKEMFRRQGLGGELGGDFASLKELVTDLRAEEPPYPVRNILIRSYQYLIAKYDIDGYRIDTLKYIEPDFAQTFGNAMREFALGIGKKNFFTFGEVYDNEEKIARFIGRAASDGGDLVGVDAALDFPLFFVLPGVAKGQIPPSELAGMFEHRKQVERGIISSHGEASRFFVTFLDNHDQRQRFFYADPGDPLRYADQLTLGVACLFTLQGIPCLYYGTEQGLHGAGDRDAAVREALWGKRNAFDADAPFFDAVARAAALRDREPALRYGRQYFRPISGDGIHFGLSPFTEGVLAFSRILNDREVVVVANTHTTNEWAGEVIVDRSLNPEGTNYKSAYSSRVLPETVTAPGTVRERSGARSLPVRLAPMELQVFVRE